LQLFQENDCCSPLLWGCLDRFFPLIWLPGRSFISKYSSCSWRSAEVFFLWHWNPQYSPKASNTYFSRELYTMYSVIKRTIADPHLFDPKTSAWLMVVISNVFHVTLLSYITGQWLLWFFNRHIIKLNTDILPFTQRKYAVPVCEYIYFTMYNVHRYYKLLKIIVEDKLTAFISSFYKSKNAFKTLKQRI
jgi:hypothetical protein